MTSLPESVLIWSTVKPEFEEVEGKWILIQFSGENCHGKQEVSKTVIVINNAGAYAYWFNNGFLRYAIIADHEPEPLALWGVGAIDYGNETVGYWIRCDCPEIIMQTHRYPTRAEAITAWNRIAVALNEMAI